MAVHHRRTPVNAKSSKPAMANRTMPNYGRRSERYPFRALRVQFCNPGMNYIANRLRAPTESDAFVCHG